MSEDGGRSPRVRLAPETAGHLRTNGAVAVQHVNPARHAVVVNVVLTHNTQADTVVDGTRGHVNTLPATSKAVVFLGSASTQYAQNLVYHKDAITFATADLLLPQGVDMAARAVHNGISLRVVRQYDINNDRMPCRIDVLYGYSTIRPQMACRLWG